jgi:hypothetical protein
MNDKVIGRSSTDFALNAARLAGLLPQSLQLWHRS